MEQYFSVVELNTRKRTFINDEGDILYGDDYKEYKCNSLTAAKRLAAELSSKGIATNIARVVKT